jgi:hypothetical protein
MRDIFLIGLIILILTLQLGCSPSYETPLPGNDAIIDNTPAQNQGAALNEGYGTKIHRAFSVQMPADWKEVEYNNIMFYLPPGSEAADQTAEKVTVIASTGIPKTNSIGSILEKGTQDMKKIVPDLNVEKKDDTRLGGFDAVRLTLTGTILGKRFENVQISTLNNDVMLTIAHNCFAGSCIYNETFQKMAGSMEVYTEYCGIEIIGFPDISPARDAGLKVGDRIISADTAQVDSFGALTHALAAKRAGDSVVIGTRDREYNVATKAGSDGNGAFIGVNIAQVYCKR